MWLYRQDYGINSWDGGLSVRLGLKADPGDIEPEGRRLSSSKPKRAQMSAIHLVTASVLFGLLFWVADGVLGYIALNPDGKSLLDCIILDLPIYALFMRSTFMVACLAGGLLTSIFLRNRRESEQRFEMLFENAVDSIFICDLEGNFLEVNRMACDRLGHTRRELLRMGYQGLETPEYAAEMAQWLETVLRDGHVVFESAFVCSDGSILPVEVNARTMELSGRQVILSVARDITERKRARQERERLQAQLQQSAKMDAMGQLAGGVAHDFNNLLTAIMGYANLLRLQSEPDTDVYNAATTIEQAADKASDLTKQLLGFARRGKHQLVGLYIHEAIQEAVSLLSRTIDRNVRITMKLDTTASVIMGDPAQIQQVFINLAVNARDAMPDGGELTIATQAVTLDEEDANKHLGAMPGRYVCVSVSDTGCGMTDEVRRHIFEPFYTTKPEGEGTGMGLATVYGIVDNHGGLVEVHSELNTGSTFKVYLPLAEAEVVAQFIPDEAGLVAGKGLILLVDDESVVRQVVSAMLRTLGYDVTTAENGKEAVEYFRDHHEKVDLVLLDMIMPRMGGRECFQVLQQIDPGVKAILATGYGRDGRAQDMLDDGIEAFIQKPYRVQEISQVVARVLTDGHPQAAAD